MVNTVLPDSREGMRKFVSMFTGFPGSPGPKPSDFGIKDPREQYGLTDEDINYFKYRDEELKKAIDKFTGMDFPIHTIDDFFIVELAGMVQKLGFDGAIAEAKKWPRRIRALLRAVGRNHKKGVI